MNNRILLILLMNWFLSVHTHAQSITNWLASLPEVGKIESIEVSQPDCTLIFIRQIHYAYKEYRPVELDDEEKFTNMLVRVHSEVFSIGTNIQNRLSLSSYYPEAVTRESLPVFLRSVEVAKRLRRNERESIASFNESQLKIRKTLVEMQDSPTVRTNKTLLESIRLRIKAIDSRKEEYKPIPYGDADQPHELRLAVEVGMHIRRSEDSESYERGNDLVYRGNPRKEPISSLGEITENRNIGALNIVAEDHRTGIETNHYSLIIFGAFHNFGRSALIWNATNNFKFNVISVTPKSMLELPH